MTMAPAQPKPIRKSSEAVAIDKLFESLGQPLGRSSSPLLIESSPSSFTDALGISPLIKQSGNEEEIFQTDLANVLVWFEKSLTSSQRITTAFTLFERLTAWQRDFVLGMLKTTEVTASVRNQAHVINTERAGEAPPGFDSTAEQPVYQPQQQKSLVGLKFEQHPSRPSSTPPHYQQYHYGTQQNFSARRTPSPLYHQQQQQQQQQRPFPSYHQKQYQSYYHHSNQSNVSLVTTSSMDSTFSTGSELTLDQCNVELFKRDIPQWLRSLRLHKYTPAIGGLSQEALLASTDEILERHGVAALGARRKLLRIFETIQKAIAENSTSSSSSS
jgi:hypothetical protein